MLSSERLPMNSRISGRLPCPCCEGVSDSGVMAVMGLMGVMEVMGLMMVREVMVVVAVGSLQWRSFGGL